MLLGYCGTDPQNPLKLEKVLAALPTLTANLQKTLVTGAGIAAPGITTTLEGAITGFSGYTLSSPPTDPARLAELQGVWAYARYCPSTAALTLSHDHFGGQPLFYTRVGDTLWYSNSFKALLAIPEVAAARQLSLKALYAYLVMAYVPAPLTLFENIHCLPPFTTLTFDLTSPKADPLPTPLFSLPALTEPRSEEEWLAELRTKFDAALQRRLGKTGELVGVALSGGLDSCGVVGWLRQAGVTFKAFHLDFGEPYNDEKLYAQKMAEFVGVPLTLVPLQAGREMAKNLRRAVWQMEQPYGDPVTLPLWMGNRAIAEAGIKTFFNGEGGDQLFAGWPNKAMFTAELYGDPTGQYDRAEAYLRTFHHFYGQEMQTALYKSALAQVAANTDLKVELSQYLSEPQLPGLFERLRWTNYQTKGSQNIMPRAAAMARAWGLEMQTPLFDLELAQFALTIPGELLLKGSVEKYLFKRVLEDIVHPEVIARTKRGMGVPATEWCRGKMRGNMKKWVGSALLKRGLFRPEYIRQLLKGEDLPSEIRARRTGEKLWQLAVLEIWLELFWDKVSFSEG